MLRIFNSLSKTIEQFKPINPAQVGMYTCGPTPYDFQHIGNFRTAIFSDILTRVLKLNGYSVKTVSNITDIDDKIIKKSQEKNITPVELTKEFIKIYFNDLDKLNILPVDVSPKATEHISKMVKYIEVLINKGFAYIEKDGSIYFDISKFPDYGKLSNLKKRQLKTGTRILSDEYEKENIQDFALWKAAGVEEIGYESTLGRGRPGWHIECSVMSQEYLGETFDLHLGGIDLIFPHHENEIAQSEAKTGQKFVKFFVHGEMMMVDGQKMSKSLGNIYTLKDLEEKGFEPVAFRYLVLTAHYRDRLNFTFNSLQASQNTLNNLREEIRSWPKADLSKGEMEKNRNWQDFSKALNNDLNTPQAMAAMWNLVKSTGPSKTKAAILLEMDKILGLNIADFLDLKVQVPEKIWKLLNEREKVRKSGDFKKSDQLREEIKNLGFDILDTENGPQLKPN